MNRRSLFTGAVLGLVGASLAPVKAFANQYMVGARPAGNMLFSGCVIRFSDPDGWPSIHANGAHMSAGVSGVEVASNGRLRVWQTLKDPARYPVLFAFVQTDETLSSRGIMAGASGGTGDTEYVFYDTRLGRALDLTQRSDRMRLQGKNSNAWLGWVHANGW